MPDQTGYVLTCIAYDAGTQACTQTAFIPPPMLVPRLSAEDANTLGGAYMASLALVMAAKLLRRG